MAAEFVKMLVAGSWHPDGQRQVIAFFGGIHPFGGYNNRVVNAHIVG